MSIARWSLFREIENMRRDMERLIDEFFVPVRRRRCLERPEGTTMSLNIDMYDRKHEIVVRAELPGM